MHIRKNELINRLASITGKHRSEFMDKTVKELSSLYESYDSQEKRIYIEVPYKEKEIAKLLGAKFDGEQRKWYIPPGIDLELFSRGGWI